MNIEDEKRIFKPNPCLFSGMNQPYEKYMKSKPKPNVDEETNVNRPKNEFQDLSNQYDNVMEKPKEQIGNVDYGKQEITSSTDRPSNLHLASPVMAMVCTAYNSHKVTSKSINVTCKPKYTCVHCIFSFLLVSLSGVASSYFFFLIFPLSLSLLVLLLL